jgi:hypothetical protein
MSRERDSGDDAKGIGNPQAAVLWHDGAMSKRSTRIAKRDEFENALKEVEEKIRSRRGKNPAVVDVAATGRREERDGESGEVELDQPDLGKPDLDKQDLDKHGLDRGKEE